jgi:signal transduction histidine kinase
MLNQLYPILILVGLTIGAVLGYLWWQARAASDLNLALIRLNEQHQFDTPAFLKHAWPLLAQSGLRGFSWQLDWFGATIEGSDGDINEGGICKKIDVGEIKLSIRFQQNLHGERRYFDIALIETFMLLLRTDMWIKAGAIDATMAQMSKLTLFLQHDMKNVAQFIQLMSDQLANVPPGKELQVLQYLRSATPLMRHRADRIVQTLTLGQAQDQQPRDLQLRDAITQMADLYQLDYKISGAAQLYVPENTLESALDNILKNYSDLYLRDGAAKPIVSITIFASDSEILIEIGSDQPVPAMQMERLFEPFWSSDPAGLGIGLYQAKQMLELCQATISAVQLQDGQLQFQIRIKKQ